MKNRNKKFIVIGSGFTSLVCTLSLIKSGYKPIILDIGTNYLTKDTYTSIFKPFFYKKKIEDYSFFGGLSEVWKGVVAGSTQSDFETIFIKDKEKLLDETLKLIKNYTFYTNELVDRKKNKFDFVKLNEIDAKNILFRNKSWIGKPIFFCKKFIKKKIIPFETKSFFKVLIKNKKIKYIKGQVQKVSKIKNKKYLFYKSQNKKINKIMYNYTFCGAGALSSSKIINNSLNLSDKSVFMNTNKKGLFLSIFKEKININLDNSHPIYQGIIMNNEKSKIYLQCYLFSQIFYNFLPNISKGLFRIILNLNIFKYLSISFVSIDQNSKVEITNESKIYAKKNRLKKFLLKNLFKKINNLQNYFTIYCFGKFLPSLAGNHFGASFYFKKQNTKKNIIFSNNIGLVNGLSNFYVIDSASLKRILCIPPTLLSMMHSLRITKKVTNKK